MICEYSYYPDGNEKLKPNCKCEEKLKEDTYFKEKCPLIYLCRINERYEQTTDMFNCTYRNNAKNKEAQK